MIIGNRIATFVLVTLFAAAPVLAAAGVRVVTYNIRQGKGQTELATPDVDVQLPFGIRLRAPSIPVPLARGAGQLDRIADGLAELRADVVCLQEVNDRSLQTLGRDQTSYLAKRLGMKHVYATAHAAGWGVVKRQGNAILSRYPIRGRQVVELSPASGPNERRIALFARIDLPDQPDGAWVASLHAESNDEEVRIASVPRLLDAVAGLRGPVILAGDFNAVPDSGPMQNLIAGSAARGRPFIDTYSAAGRGPGETSGAPAGRRRIDYILATEELWPTGAWSQRDLNESDHFAVVADLVSDRTTPAAGLRLPARPGASLLGVLAR